MTKKMSNRTLVLFGFLLIFLAICHANLGLESIEGGKYFEPWVMFLVQVFTIFMIFRYRRILCPDYLDDNHKYINYYLRWTYIWSLFGVIIAENYIEYRQVLVGVISLLVPILSWLFYRPSVTLKLLSIWYKYAWIPFLLFFYFKLGFVLYYVQPILILICLFPLFSKRVIWIILVLGFLIATEDFVENRATLILIAVATMTGIGIGVRNILSNKLIRIGHVFCYLCSIFLFVFIFADAFSVFTGKTDANDVVNSNRDREMVSKDTRSLLYIDLVNSAINNNCLIWGHTPARGFEIVYSGVLFWFDKSVFYNKNERHKSEMLLANIFSWEGLIGIILYSMIYMRGSYLAVYRSKNRIIPILGCFLAWRWSWGWVGDVNNFLLLDVDLWALMAICYSPHFREMSEHEFITWTRGLLSKKYRTSFKLMKLASKKNI